MGGVNRLDVVPPLREGRWVLTRPDGTQVPFQTLGGLYAALDIASAVVRGDYDLDGPDVQWRVVGDHYELP